MDLPKQFDVLFLGSGLTESIVSAACSRAGKTVLHIDQNDFYGAEWTSFTFNQLNTWVAAQRAQGDTNSLVSNIHCCELFPPDQETCKWTKDEIEKVSNRINIDLCPRLIYSSGPMVDLLIKSNICRYLEFTNCSQLYLIRDEAKVVPIPSTRSSIFSSKILSVIQKRRLMSFMNFCFDLNKSEEQDLSQYAERSFKNLMDDHQLDSELQEILSLVVSMKNSDCSAQDALLALQLFSNSAGRFGDTPFLATIYGSGELPQAFCRLSAVFGGTFCLNVTAENLKKEDDEFEFEIQGSSIKSQFLVGSISNIPQKFLSSRPPLQKSSHVVCLTNRSLAEESSVGKTNLFRMAGQRNGITVLELSNSSLCVPRGLFLVHICCEANEASAKQDLMPIIKSLFSMSNESNNKPMILWYMFYNMSYANCPIISQIPEKVFIVDGPVLSMDYEKCIKEAKDTFEKMFPGEDFLPRAPDAEDIVIEVVSENGSTDE